MVLELLLLPFDSSLEDSAQRHAAHVFEYRNDGSSRSGSPQFDSHSALGNTSIRLGMNQFIKVTGLQSDFCLGATPILGNEYRIPNDNCYRSTLNDNHFTLDCWVYLSDLRDLANLPVFRYRTICSSFYRPPNEIDFVPSNGWSLRIDSQTGKLQMVGFHCGYTTIFESTFSLPLERWTHIAVQSWQASGPGVLYGTLHMMWKDGQPDKQAAYQFPDMNFNNVDILPNNFFAFYPLYIGMGPTHALHVSQQDLKLYVSRGIFGYPWCGSRLVGNLSNLRICYGPRFPSIEIEVFPFVPPRNEGTPTTTTVTTTTTWTSTTRSYTTTTQLPLYRHVSHGGYVQASHAYADFPGENAFNGNSAIPWRCDPQSGPPYWITYYWTNARYAVDEYRMYLETPGRPKAWKFRGSDDGIMWYELDEQTDIVQEGLWVGRIDNTGLFRYYQVYILETFSSAHATTINEIRLYENAKYCSLEDSLNYVGYRFKDPKLVQMYMIYVKEDSKLDCWKFQGSHDGIFWDDLDIRFRPDYTGWGKFEFENSTYYRYYRLLILAWRHLAQGTPGIAELRLFRRP